MGFKKVGVGHKACPLAARGEGDGREPAIVAKFANELALHRLRPAPHPIDQMQDHGASSRHAANRIMAPPIRMEEQSGAVAIAADQAQFAMDRRHIIKNRKKPIF